MVLDFHRCLKIILDLDFTNKHILITGGSRGIGRATAQAFAAAGGTVAISFLQNEEAARETLGSLSGEGHFAVQADLSDPKEVQDLMETVFQNFETLDVVVNNAGIYLPHPLASSSYEAWQVAWQATLDLNLTGVANVCFFAAKQMINQGRGCIVNVSSRGAFRGEPEHSAYGASKAGLNALTQSLAKELGKHGIAVAAVAPGFVETDMTAAILESRMGGEIRGQSPFGRVAKPEEVAHAILFLASPKSQFSSGTILDVNGASYLR